MMHHFSINITSSRLHEYWTDESVVLHAEVALTLTVLAQFQITDSLQSTESCKNEVIWTDGQLTDWTVWITVILHHRLYMEPPAGNQIVLTDSRSGCTLLNLMSLLRDRLQTVTTPDMSRNGDKQKQDNKEALGAAICGDSDCMVTMFHLFYSLNWELLSCMGQNDNTTHLHWNAFHYLMCEGKSTNMCGACPSLTTTTEMALSKTFKFP